ncbi:MAG: glycosyltransferase [Kiritimatiellae bacterium]|nr:glycosyltransferase [Kiritimatiellia bacterium]
MQAFDRNLTDLARLLDAHPEHTPESIAVLCLGPDPDRAVGGYGLEIARHWAAGDPAAAADALERARRRFGLLPPALFVLQHELRLAAGEAPGLARDLLRYGCDAVAAGQYDLGLEALGKAYVMDMRHGFGLTRDIQAALEAAGAYERAAGACPPIERRPADPAADPLVHVGLVVPNQADAVVAYSRRVLHFARHVDRAGFRLSVYVTENMCPRAGLLPTLYASEPTAVRGPATLAELGRLGVPVRIGSTRTPITTAALELARQMAQDAVDVVVLQAGLAMPIDWLATRLAPAPAKLQIHIGLSAYQRGIQATLFDNAVNMAREAAAWPEWAGRQVLVRRGTDIAALDACTPAARAAFGIPADAVLIGTLSNSLDARLSPAFCETMAGVLAAGPRAWYAAGGVVSAPDTLKARFARRGVADRVVFAGQQREPGTFLKMLDIYANEFPTGGSQSVVEAMACGLPVAAMRCADTHAESVGADIVGEPPAIPAFDPRRYRALLETWLRDAAARKAAGRRLRERAEREFSVRTFVRRVCELGAEYARAGCRGASPVGGARHA